MDLGLALAMAAAGVAARRCAPKPSGWRNMCPLNMYHKTYKKDIFWECTPGEYPHSAP